MRPPKNLLRYKGYMVVNHLPQKLNFSRRELLVNYKPLVPSYTCLVLLGLLNIHCLFFYGACWGGISVGVVFHSG